MQLPSAVVARPSDGSGSTPGSISVLSRLVRGTDASGLNQAISGLQSIVLVPLFLRAWGTETYGQWVALTALVGYLSLLDLGGQSYVGNILAMSHARGDEEKFRSTLSDGVSLYVALGLVGFAFVSAAALLAPHLSMGRFGTFQPWQAIVVLLLACNFLLL